MASVSSQGISFECVSSPQDHLFVEEVSLNATNANMVAEWGALVAPRNTSVVVDHIRPVELFDEAEAAAVAGSVASRYAEFSTGRQLARKALLELGFGPTSLPPDIDRVPVWPKGAIGTLSHSGDLCIAHAGLARHFCGIGIDIEVNRPIEPRLVPMILTQDELGLDAFLVDVDPALLAFVAKEAAYKAYYPATRNFLDFLDLRVDFDPTDQSFSASLIDPNKVALGGQRCFFGKYALITNYVIAAVWVERDSAQCVILR